MLGLRSHHPMLVILVQGTWENHWLWIVLQLREQRGGPLPQVLGGLQPSPGSASLTHIFPLVPFTLARKDNSLVCPHPGPRHKSPLLACVVTAPQVSSTFFAEFPINVVYTKKGLACLPSPKAILLWRRAGKGEGWGLEEEGGGRKR